MEVKPSDKSKLPNVSAEIVLSYMKKFVQASDLHKLTRGVHSSVLLDLEGNEIVFVDEIGRHNAVDKIIGYAAKNSISLGDKMIFSTGRLSSEILYKTIYSGAKVIVSKAAPTSLSVELARENNIILIANVRSNRFDVLNGYENIVV